MKTWLLTDTHFGHGMLVEKGYRPAGFETKIIDHWVNQIDVQDLVIHLGDVALTGAGTEYWPILKTLPGRKILCRGNHDNHSDHWYLTRGPFDFVCERFVLKQYGKRLLFSHVPQPKDSSWDWNIHGHLHDNEDRLEDSEVACVWTPDHLLLSLEEEQYRPVLLSTFLKRFL